MPGDARVLSTDSGPGLLDEVHALLEALWGEHADVQAADRFALTTAVAELAANVVEHAAVESVVPVRLEVRVDDERIVAVLEDSGVDFPGEAPPSDDPLAESGRGLVMARALCEELTYVRDGELNRWRMVRRRG